MENGQKEQNHSLLRAERGTKIQGLIVLPTGHMLEENKIRVMANTVKEIMIIHTIRASTMQSKWVHAVLFTVAGCCPVSRKLKGLEDILIALTSCQI